ncbi:hypothetical protein TNCV_3455651 [Trichonephila clavipes]|nr:hypothetical protein TNCV_3455651 [Trichonephila clavipes]
MITTNIDGTDGLANGAVGKLVHVETNDVGLIKAIWLEFPDLPQIGEKLRRKKTISSYLYKITEYQRQNQILRLMQCFRDS